MVVCRWISAVILQKKLYLGGFVLNTETYELKSKCIVNSRKGRSFFTKLKEYKILLLMILPAVLYFFIFSYVPMFGALLAFKSFNYRSGILGSPWVGLENFKFFFQSGQAFLVTKNTLLYNAAFLIIDTTLQITAAIILAEIVGKYFKKTVQSMMFLPHFISWVVVGAFVYNIFNYEYGLLNSILQYFNMEKVNVYSKPEVWKYILVFFKAWKAIGYGSIIYLAAIMGIDSEIYESAKIDGANIWQRIFKITLPSLVPTIIILVLMSIGGIFRGDFSMFYQIIGDNGLLYNQTDIIDTFVFRSLMKNSEVGMAAAVGIYQSVLCFVLIMVTNGVVKKVDRDSALF